MVFDLGEISEKTESGVIRGVQREIACDCWFTSRGKTIPKLIKIMDEEGILHTLRNIEILATEEKTFSGIQTIEHTCRIRLGKTEKIVKLIYTKENCRWSIVDTETYNR